MQETEKKLENAVNAILSGITSAALQTTMQQLEQQKAALETEVRLLQTDAPELKLEHFQYFAHRLLEVQAEGTEKILQLLVNQVIVYKEQITVLVNLTDKTKTPPLEQVTAALRESSCSIACGGGDAYSGKITYWQPFKMGKVRNCVVFLSFSLNRFNWVTMLMGFT